MDIWLHWDFERSGHRGDNIWSGDPNIFVIPLKLHLNVLIIAKNNDAKHNTAPDP